MSSEFIRPSSDVQQDNQGNQETVSNSETPPAVTQGLLGLTPEPNSAENPEITQQQTFETRTGNILYQLVRLTPNTAVLRCILERGWTIKDVAAGKEPLLQLKEAAGIDAETTIHCIITFTKGTATQNLEHSFSSSMTSTIKKTEMVANGAFFVVLPPLLYSMLFNATIPFVGGKNMFFRIDSNDNHLTSVQAREKLETAMKDPRFEEKIKAIASQRVRTYTIEEFVTKFEVDHQQ